MLKDKTVVIGVSGGIAVYKTLDVVSRLRKLGVNVNVIMTKSATEFVTPLSFQSLSQNYVVCDMFEDPKTWDVEHISLAKRADVFLIAPATANVIGKIANGIADDMLTTTVMATKAKVLIAPAMNTNMYENPILQRNINTLKELGYNFVEPESGRLACGDTGKGKLASPETIVDEVVKMLSKDQDLKGKSIIVTAGPTIESIDPMRYITNRSTGKMGYSIAKEAIERGADVTLITGPTNLTPPQNLKKLVKIESAKDMYEAVLENLDENIVNEATFYNQQNIPSQISKALYLYGSTTDYQVLGFVDASDDGSQGMIFTDQGVYFCFKEPHSFLYEDIEELVLVKKEEGFDFYAKIKTKANTFVFKNKYLNLKGFIECLSEILEMPVHYEMSAYEKVEYFVPIVLNDLKEDVYEDLELNEQHFQQIKDIEHELEMAKELKNLDYQDECRSLCRYCLDFFESLGLDSDEIDALNEAQSFFDQQDSQENQQLEGAKRWVDEMMSNYQNGDTGMYDQMKSTMENLGIDEEKLNNMSNEEVDQYVKEMCKKFGISQSLFDKLKDRFGK